MPPRKRKGFFDDFFGGFFGDIDSEFARMREHMERSMEEAQKAQRSGKAGGPGQLRVDGPLVYGFSMRMGPDGKPVINQFGNMPPKIKAGEGKAVGEETREPLVDVIEDKNETIVVAEVPGVERKDIRLDATENELKISVDAKERKYQKTVSFKALVKPETAKATYKNGVLEVRLDRKGPAKEKETRIKID